MEELISVITPIYNVDRYINKCITSVVNQTYKNLEIIIVDDGSTDKSSKICDEWEEKDSRIKVIHKENGGVSSARNTGIKNAKGKYIFFVDSDDYIDEDLIEVLYKNMIESNVDIVTAGYIMETYATQKERFGKENYIENSEQVLKRLFLYDDMYVVIWGNLYKKELFDDIEFPVGKIAEDLAVIYKLFDKANMISHINKCGYHYTQRQDSIMHQKYDADQLSVIGFVEEIIEFTKEKYPNLVDYAENLLLDHIIRCSILCYHSGLKKEYKWLINKARTNMKKMLKNPVIKPYTKFKTFLIAYLGIGKILVIDEGRQK